MALQVVQKQQVLKQYQRSGKDFSFLVLAAGAHLRIDT